MKEIIEKNKAIALWMGEEPTIEYCVGNESSSCFHPAHCGTTWPPQQKAESERWISEHKEYAARNSYTVQREEWWPWYNQDWNKLMSVYHRIREKAFEMKDNNEVQVYFSRVMQQVLYGDIGDVWRTVGEFIMFLKK